MRAKRSAPSPSGGRRCSRDVEAFRSADPIRHAVLQPDWAGLSEMSCVRSLQFLFRGPLGVGFRVVIPVLMRRPLLALQTHGYFPFPAAVRTDASRCERIPDGATAPNLPAASPTAIGLWPPFTLGAVNLLSFHGCPASTRLKAQKQTSRTSVISVRNRPGSRRLGLA